MTLHKILDKICKCLRLAESANPNEAASALRQAVSLMRKYDISDEQVDTHEVSINQMNEISVNSCSASKPAYWILALSNLVAEAFDCRVYISRKEQAKPEFIFIGADNRPEVASYLYTILYRSLGRARVRFMKGLSLDKGLEAEPGPGLGAAKERRRRANIFAQAWLFRVSSKIKIFKNNNPNENKTQKNKSQNNKVQKNNILDEYVNKKYGLTLDYMQSPIETEAPDYDDIIIGMRAAEDVSLFRPLRKTDNRLLLVAAS